MIEGLKVTITGDELRQLCMSRAKHHRDRAATYEKQIESLQADSIEGMNYTNGNPIETLKDRKAKHEDEAAELTFIGEHIDVSASYLLERGDLNKLGICKSRY